MLFFLGIFLAVSSLEATGLLDSLATWLDQVVGNIDLIIFLIGLMSAIIDNVPLVAAAMGMYDLAQFPTDSPIWQFLAFEAGGGSCLIIGSAAGVRHGMGTNQFLLVREAYYAAGVDGLCGWGGDLSMGDRLGVLPKTHWVSLEGLVWIRAGKLYRSKACQREHQAVTGLLASGQRA